MAHDRPLPPPSRRGLPPRELLAELAGHLGEREAARACAGLLAGEPDPDLVLFLGDGRGRSVLDGGSWRPYWARVWGARGLLYVWDDAVAGHVLDGLRDEHWRVAEMCLKVSVRHALPVGDDGARLAGHHLPRVRVAAARALAAGGDVEHVEVVAGLVADDDGEVRRTAARAVDAMRERLDLS